MMQTSFSGLTTAHDEQGILKSRDYLHSLIKAEIDKGIPSSRIILGTAIPTIISPLQHTLTSV